MALLACTAGIMTVSAQKKVALKVSTVAQGAESKTVNVTKDKKGYITLFDGKTLTDGVATAKIMCPLAGP